jgi:hypothetical protein
MIHVNMTASDPSGSVPLGDATTAPAAFRSPDAKRPAGPSGHLRKTDGATPPATHPSTRP